MLNKPFKKLAIGLSFTAAMMGASVPALAGVDFVKGDFRDKQTASVQLAGQELSTAQGTQENDCSFFGCLTLVIHGGNKTLITDAYTAAARLDEEGYKVAFLLAPDRDGGAKRHDGNDITATVEYYTDGYTKYYSMLFDNDVNTSTDRVENIYQQGIAAYNYAQDKIAKKAMSEGITIASASPN